MQATIPTFAGRWELDGTDYQFGKGPVSGSYTITFSGVLDGGPFPYHSTTIADHMAFYQVSDTVIRSEAFKGGHRIHWATRTLSGDGSRRTIQVYGRHAAGDRPGM